MGALGVTLAAYASCNIDDLVVLAVLFAQARDARGRRVVAVGQLIGIMCVWALSLACALGLQAVLGPYVRFVGVVPLVVGVKYYLDARRSDETGQDARQSLTLSSMVLVAISNGGDDVGVLVPLMVGWGVGQLVVSAVAFAAMTLVWCRLARGVAAIPVVQQVTERYARYVVPLVLAWIGLSVLLG